jgi:hypothetical protein
MAATGTGNRVWIGSGDITLPMLTATGVGGDDKFFKAPPGRTISVAAKDRRVSVGPRNQIQADGDRTTSVDNGGRIIRVGE